MTTRVLHVVESLQPEAGSVSISLAGLFRALRALDFESAVWTANGPSKVGGSPGEDAGTSRTPPQSDADAVSGADVVHLHGWEAAVAQRVATVASKSGTPYVISPLGSLCESAHAARSVGDRIRRMMGEKRLLRRVAALAAVNKTEYRELETRGDDTRVELLPYGVDFGDYETDDRMPGRIDAESNPTQKGRDRRCLLVLAPIHPVEGFVPLLKALSELGEVSDDWDLVFAGAQRGDWRRMLDAAIRRKGGEDRVRFEEAPDEARQRACLSRASLLLAPSLQVRCGVSVLQAVATGVPVLATQCAAPPGLDEAIGVCAPNRGDLKVALRSLLRKSDDELAGAARRARELGLAALDWPVLVDSYAELYRTSIRE